jgi:hypothetical protein
MWTETELSNFSHHLRTTPRHLWGRLPVVGAFDSRGGARDHGADRRLERRDFARGGAFDAAGDEPESGKDLALLRLLAQRLSPKDWAELQGVLCGGEAAEDGLADVPEYKNGLPKNAAAIAAEDALIATLGGVRDAGGRPIATSARAVRQHALDVASRVVLGA